MDGTRTAELEGLARALALSGGSAPGWLAGELLESDICAASRTPEAGRSLTAAALSLACLFAAVIAGVTLDAPVRAARTARERHIPPDLRARDAVALVQAWSPAGDELPVLQRLGGVTRHHGGLRAWSAERSGPGSYLVLYREPDGSAYAFEADVRAGAVRASPETVDRLALLRVREEAAHGLLARAH